MRCGKRLYFVSDLSVDEARIKYKNKDGKSFYPALKIVGELKKFGDDGRASIRK
jgi:hypothetical protein